MSLVLSVESLDVGSVKLGDPESIGFVPSSSSELVPEDGSGILSSMGRSIVSCDSTGDVVTEVRVEASEASGRMVDAKADLEVSTHPIQAPLWHI